MRFAMKHSCEHLGDVLVLGLGKSGKSVARYMVELLGDRVDSVFVAAGAHSADSEAFVNEIAREGVEHAFGDDALADSKRHFNLCIASPGIPFWHDLYVDGARLSDELISEVEFAWRESVPDSIWVAVTGTNGKTTTTSLAAHVLRECGFAAAAVGNIGDVCLDAVASGDVDVYVTEVSSYQLESTRFFAPDVAVLLNITPDHIHWHRTLEAYRDAKFKVLRPLEATSEASASEGGLRFTAILDATNDVVRAKVRELKAKGASYIPLGTADGIGGDMRARCNARNAAFMDADGVLTIAYDGVDHALLPASDLKIKGEHNASNALAAAAVAVVLGAQDADVSRALASFQPLEHRIEPCGVVEGVECFNDSKATNVDATCKALGAFPDKRLMVLLGGDDKGTELDELISCVHEHACVAVCFGEAGPRFFTAFEQVSDRAPASFSLLRADHLEDALDVALSQAESGDVVLLSPACASFDEFKSFEQRGQVFKQLVADRARAAEMRG